MVKHTIESFVQIHGAEFKVWECVLNLVAHMHRHKSEGRHNGGNDMVSKTFQVFLTRVRQCWTLNIRVKPFQIVRVSNIAGLSSQCLTMLGTWSHEGEPSIARGESSIARPCKESPAWPDPARRVQHCQTLEG